MACRCLYPADYRPILDLVETERAIRAIKESFQQNLESVLNLRRVTAPLFVRAGSGINDDLNGIELPVSFEVPAGNIGRAEIVQSLAKWKRMALADYGFEPGEGLYTDMNAIRPNEDLDNMHSLYVDQWDWERVIGAGDRNLAFLRTVVRQIYEVLRCTEQEVCRQLPAVSPVLPEAITFIHAAELEERYPGMTAKEREDAACLEFGAVFVIGIGAALGSGEPHDGRAPDYDDWSTPNEDGFLGLNGDILVWYPVLGRSFELSSMGIRVDPAALERQLAIRGAEERKRLMWHRRLLGGAFPLSIGGGIGQSRLCMFLLRKAHIGEVQVSLWPEEMIHECREQGIVLL